MISRVVLPLDAIDNYRDNPRTGHVASAYEEIKKLFAQQSTKMMVLAANIADKGFDSSEPIIVVEESGKYVVYDGNRRIAALKVLKNPDGYDFLTDRQRKKLVDLSATALIPDVVEVVVKNREDALEFMQRVHGGEQGGKGHTDWGAEEKRNFDSLRGKIALTTVLDKEFHKEYGYGLNDVLPTTTVERILKNKLVASKLQIDAAKPRTRKELDYIRGVLQKAKDLAGEESVTRFFARSKDIQEKLLPHLGDIFSEEDYSKSDSANKQEKESNAANGRNCKDENDRNEADGQKSNTRSVQSPLFQSVDKLPSQRDRYTRTARNIMTCCNQLWHSDKSKYAPVVAPSLRSIMELAFNRLREKKMLDITPSSSFTGRQENTQVLALRKRMLGNKRELTDVAKCLGESFTSVKNCLEDEKYLMEAYTSANSWAHTSTLIGGDTLSIEAMAPRIELFALLLFMWPEVK